MSVQGENKMYLAILETGRCYGIKKKKITNLINDTVSELMTGFWCNTYDTIIYARENNQNGGNKTRAKVWRHHAWYARHVRLTYGVKGHARSQLTAQTMGHIAEHSTPHRSERSDLALKCRTYLMRAEDVSVRVEVALQPMSQPSNNTGDGEQDWELGDKW